MRELSPAELPGTVALGKGRFTLIFLKVAGLEVGKGIVVERSDFVTKGTPYRIFKNVMKKTGHELRFGRMTDGSGWFVQRVA